MGSDTRDWTLVDVRRRAMDLLARREHGVEELARKLKQKGLPVELVEEAVGQLESDGLVSDVRYCEGVIRSRAGRGQGPLKIRHELRSHGTPDDIIEQAFDTIDPDWEDVLSRVYQKKYAGMPAGTPSERAKKVRFLSSRGFSQEMIHHFLQRLE